MAFRIFVGSVLASVVLMAWGFVFWMFTTVPQQTLRDLPVEEKLVKTLKEMEIEDGTYFVPFPSRDAITGDVRDTKVKYDESRTTGPIIQINYRQTGESPENPTVYIKGFAHYFVVTLLAATLLCVALPRLNRYFARVSFVFALGLFAVLTTRIGDIIWFYRPWQFDVMLAGFGAVGWFLAALVLALIVREKRA
jgi:hypothetical protein